MRDFDPDQSFGFNLHDAARLLRRDFERRADPDDRRAWRLHLTATASARLETLRAVGRDARDVALAGISLKDQEVLLVALKRIRDNFTTPR